MAMSIVTRRGDEGETDLLFGVRVSKGDERIGALGDVDELNAALGWVRVHAKTEEALKLAAEVQLDLIRLMGELATVPTKSERYEETHGASVLSSDALQRLDDLAAWLEKEGAFQFAGWVLPGAAGLPGGAACDAARTTCRRAERSVLGVLGKGLAARYLNRLSDVLWLLARWEER
jgi:cob(I)alamin adenosyltransferase